MTEMDITCAEITDGDASRYIKPAWVESGVLSTAAFDLRDGEPPEIYVSHFLAEGLTPFEKFSDAYSSISARIKKCNRGGIALLDIAEVLDAINDDSNALVAFREAGLPHCGLYYLSEMPQDRLEVKAVLCLIASKRLVVAGSIRAGEAITDMLQSE